MQCCCRRLSGSPLGSPLLRSAAGLTHRSEKEERHGRFHQSVSPNCSRKYYNNWGHETTRGPWITPRRQLTTNQLVSALRPFYFRVHPDRFGRHPRAKAVNEESLKTLNDFLTSITVDTPRPEILSNAPGSRTIELEFFIKPPSNNHMVPKPNNESSPDSTLSLSYNNSDSSLNDHTYSDSPNASPVPVRVKLKRHDARGTIRRLLESCHLDAEIVRRIDGLIGRLPPAGGYETMKNENGRAVTTRTTLDRWGDAWKFEMRSDQEEPGRWVVEKRKVAEVERRLVGLASEARQTLAGYCRVRKNFEDAVHRIKQLTGFADIVLSSESWSLQNCLGLLRLLERMFQQQLCRDSIMSANIVGRKLKLGSVSGLLADGSVGLSLWERPDEWVMALRALEPQSVVDDVRLKEQGLSAKLHGMNVTVGEFVQLKVYRKWLDHVTKNVELSPNVAKWSNLIPDREILNQRSKNDINGSGGLLTMEIQSSHSALSLSPVGTFWVPYDCEFSKIVQFMEEWMEECLAKRCAVALEEEKMGDIRDLVMRKFSLASISWSEQIDAGEVVICLANFAKLENIPQNLLAKLHLHIDQRFKVTEDGKLVIPVDWWRSYSL